MSKNTLKITADVKDNKAVIRIDGRISQWNNYASGFKAQLDEIISQGVTDATIYLNTPGGDCFEANEIANEISRFKGTTTAVLGALCASAGTYIACKCTTVIAAKNVSYMIHKPMTYIEGNSDQIKADLKLLENLQAQYASTYSEKTGLSVQKIESLWVEDYWMNSEEAKKLGFIDQIEGETQITEQDVQAIKGYKGAPAIVATVILNDTTKIDIMKDRLITVLALSAAMTETEIIAHIDVLKAKANKADELQTKLTNLENASKKEKVDAELSKAKATKKITEVQAGFWEKQLNNDFEAAKATLDSMPSAIQLSKETGGGSGEGSGKNEDNSKWTYADWMEKNPEGLKKMARNDEAGYIALGKAYFGENF